MKTFALSSFLGLSSFAMRGPALDMDHKSVTLPKKPADHDARRKALVVGQVTELLSNYGKINLIWFDGGHGEISNTEVRRLQPGIVINRRNCGGGDYGDSEGKLPDKRFEGWFETCETCWPSNKWSYTEAWGWDTAPETLEKLVRLRAWGGNLLANVGPQGDGSIPAPALTAWNEMANWMTHNRESVIGAGPGPFPDSVNAPVTTGKGVAYVHFLPSFKEEVIWKNAPKYQKATLLRTGEAVPITHLYGAESTLESDFKNPPVKTRPYVWWHWMGSNFSKEGITKDLESMKASGIGGATIFNIASAVQESHKPTLNNPWPDQTYRSPKYWEALRHAAAEAQRLGLEIGLHNTVGYSTTGGPWIDEEKNMQNLVSKTITVEGGKRVSIEIPRPDPTTYRSWGNTGRSFTFFKDIAILAVPATGDIDPSKVIDLTSSFKDSRLDWDAPAGSWQVFRLAHAPTGANPHPLPDELVGKTLEVDKLSRDLNVFHWDQVIEPMKVHLGAYLGKSFKHFLIDSYEAGTQSWTPAFREEFKQRKGYDPLPWLLALQNRIVGDKDLSARFKWDHDDFIRTLYYENGWRTGHEKIKAVGMNLQFEPYGGQFDTVAGTALADLPMGEFWTGKVGGISETIVAAARAAGRTVVGAEPFTGPPVLSKWSETPSFLKRSADGTFSSGANRLILHHWVHQPFDDCFKPGMGMGWWGTHFNRHQTWAKDGTAFFQYLGRTQALLQSGETPSDFVSVGKSQGSDIISWREFRDGLKVRDGRIVVSFGRSYPFLGIPHDGRLLPEDVSRIESLLKEGAVIICARPGGSPGLRGYPQSDAEVKASTLWNDEPVRSVGKGKLYTKGDTAAAVRDFKITPLIQFPGASGIAGTARQTKDETLFFVANITDRPNTFTASFHITGKRPELWDAENGTIRFAPVWRQKDGRTEVDLTLNAYRSIFVVFRDSKLPADFEWGEDRAEKGHAMKAYLEWFLKSQPRPEQNRKCFVTWYYHRKHTALLPAGLIGPVTLVPQSTF